MSQDQLDRIEQKLDLLLAMVAEMYQPDEEESATDLDGDAISGLPGIQ